MISEVPRGRSLLGGYEGVGGAWVDTVFAHPNRANNAPKRQRAYEHTHNDGEGKGDRHREPRKEGVLWALGTAAPSKSLAEGRELTVLTISTLSA